MSKVGGNITAVGDELAALVAEHYRDPERGVHAETMIGALAALAGEWSLVAIGQPLPDTGWVVASQATELLIEGDESAWALLSQIVISRGLVDSGNLPDPIQVVAQTAAAIGSSPFPPLTVPDGHYPLEWSPVAGPRFREAITEMALRKGMTDRQMLLAMMVAIGLVIEGAREVLNPAVAIRLALEIMIGVSRMAPLDSEDQYGRQE